MAIVTLADAKAELNLSSAQYDTELQAYIDAVTAPIERHIGAVENRSVTETGRLSPDWTTLILAKPPVVAVTAMVAVRDGVTAYDVTALYVYNALAGLVKRKDGGLILGGPYTTTYTAGRTTVPQTVNLAGRKIVAHLWRAQRGQVGPTVGADELVPDQWGFGFDIPRGAAQLLDSAGRIPLVG